MNIRDYWTEVIRREQELPPEAWVTSVANQRLGSVGGCTVLVPRRLAAEYMTRGTHRLATDEEIKAEIEAQEKRRVEYAEIEYRRKQNFAMPREMSEVVSALTALASREVNTSKGKRE